MDSEYEHECCRAELLGLPRPNWDEFLASRSRTAKESNEEDEKFDEEEAMTADKAENEAVQREGYSRMAGGLDELNSILQSTQKKINRFKNVCGSFTSLLRVQITNRKDREQTNDGNTTINVGDVENVLENQLGEEPGKILPSTSPIPQKKTTVASDSDKLDSLISKAERAEISLSKQNKQMKKFLN